jgi:hypothetical protein
MPFIIMRTNTYDRGDGETDTPICVVRDETQADRMVEEANVVADHNRPLIKRYADRSLMRNIPWDFGPGGLVEVSPCRYWAVEVPDLSGDDSWLESKNDE